MSKVDIISQQWCDLVFEGRNKSYGAYDLRSKAGRRHVLALIDILIGIGVLAALIFSYSAAKKAYEATVGVDEQAVTELSELKKDEPKKEEKKDRGEAGRRETQGANPKGGCSCFDGLHRS